MTGSIHTFVAYDPRSGVIVGVRHGLADPGYEWEPTFDASPDVAILRVPLSEHMPGKYYAVDAGRRQLIETDAEKGISFGFGRTASLEDDEPAGA